jgi:hypothetical protein
VEPIGFIWRNTKLDKKNSVGTVQAAALKKKLLLGTAKKRDIEKYNVLRR